MCSGLKYVLVLVGPNFTPFLWPPKAPECMRVEVTFLEHTSGYSIGWVKGRANNNNHCGNKRNGSLAKEFLMDSTNQPTFATL